MICELLVDAILGLIEVSEIKLSAEEEQKLSKKIFTNYKLDIFSRNENNPARATLRTVGKILNNESNELIRQISVNTSIDLLIKELKINHFGYFIKEFSQHIKEMDYFKNKYIVVCLDECECLSHEQSLVLNTLIRITETPITYITAFVRTPYDMNSTYLPNLTLQRADREIIALDDFAQNDVLFEELADGVANVRIRKALEKNVSFSTRKLLGALNLNKLLTMRLNSSESKMAKEILESACQFAQSDFFRDQSTESDKENGVLPVYYSYLCDKLQLAIPTRETSRWERRAQESREIRKKMVGAYLAICEDCNIDVWYAYAEMLIQCCDSCLRDYLWQMEELYKVSNLKLEEFVNCKLSEGSQNIALKKASVQKRESIIVQDKIRTPKKTERLIDSLAKITHLLQSKSLNDHHLRSPERGIFVLGRSGQPSEQEVRIISLIEEASEAGFLRIIKQDSQVLHFRVHTSLSPSYMFSYRGAYYSVNINVSDLQMIIEDDDGASRDKNVVSLYKRLSGQGDEPLFEGKDVWDAK